MNRAGERQPITRPRSEWREISDEVVELVAELGGSTYVRIYDRRVGDGSLRAVRSVDAGREHLSISWAPNGARQAPRYPTWDEIADARDALLPPEMTFCMYLPKRGEYVAVHATTFHLHEVAS